MHESTFFLVGPTASGKSAVDLAATGLFGGVCGFDECVSRDGYWHSEAHTVGTRRGGASWRGCSGTHGGVPCRCLDGAIQPAWSEASPPLVCGGTGLYVKCFRRTELYHYGR